MLAISLAWTVHYETVIQNFESPLDFYNLPWNLPFQKLFKHLFWSNIEKFEKLKMMKVFML